MARTRRAPCDRSVRHGCRTARLGWNDGPLALCHSQGRQELNLETLYAWFERIISAALLPGMAIVIVLATFSFLRATFEATLDVASPLDCPTFQLLFDRVLAAIIAVDLAHSVQQMAAGQRGIVQVRTVIVIGSLPSCASSSCSRSRPPRAYSCRASPPRSSRSARFWRFRPGCRSRGTTMTARCRLPAARRAASRTGTELTRNGTVR